MNCLMQSSGKRCSRAVISWNLLTKCNDLFAKTDMSEELTDPLPPHTLL